MDTDEEFDQLLLEVAMWSVSLAQRIDRATYLLLREAYKEGYQEGLDTNY